VIYAGLKAGVGPDQFRRAIDSGKVEPLLHRFEARTGDAILIEAGTVHAIGAGVLLAEIQQMSDATFRVFDWNRVGPDGKPRALHVELAMQSIDFQRGPVHPLSPRLEKVGEAGSRKRLASSCYFELEQWTIRRPATIGRRDRFTILMGLGGQSAVVYGAESFPLEFGQTMLLPAAVGACPIVPHDEAVVLSCVVP
jgi:mannose-6-phosphate isomerase